MIAEMGDMGGMDMSSDGMFYNTNSALARLFWYLVAAFLALCLLFRIIRALIVFRRYGDST
jgi:preprotein translocase subunit SecG